MGKRPNLLYVFADQLRYASCGYAGDPRARTPQIDRFAGESVNVCNAVSGHPVCAPYRASLFTGKYTTSTGMVINELRLNPDHRCFGHVLCEHGYRTAYIGKWHLYADELGNHYDPKNSFIPKGPDRLGFDGFFAAYNFHHEYYGEHAYYHLDTPEKIFVDGYEPDAQTDMAIEQLARLSEQDAPFALFLSLGTPHDPWSEDNVPPQALARFAGVSFPLPDNYLPDDDPYADGWARLTPDDRAHLPEWMRVYAAMVSNLDDNFGRLLAALDRLGLWEDTIVVFTSDHGEMFGAHGRRAKNIFYEEAVRVPFLLRWPGRAAPGVCDACLNTVDILPTLLPMLGLPVPAEAEGMDLGRKILTGEGPEPDGALMMCTGPTALFADGHEWRALRDKRYTYAVYRRDGRELLFDNQADPLQRRDLAADPAWAETKAALRARMQAKMARIGDTFEPCSYYRDHWIRDRRILRTATQHADLMLPPRAD